jgi:hypothetical protein
MFQDLMPNLRIVAVGLVVILILNYVRVSLREGLRSLPGPVLARFSYLYRLLMVYNGDGPLNYRKIHQKYGPIVRVGPNEVSVADPNMIPVIYGIGSKFTKVSTPGPSTVMNLTVPWKTTFYAAMAPVYQGAVLDSMFTARDPVYHKSLKSSVAQIFSMTNMKNFEVYADECTQIFMEAMLTLEGQPVDFSMWLQWYAFDVIGAITFQRRFGFMEQRRDVDDMIGKIDIGLQYVKIVGQLPFLIPLLQKGLMSRSFQRLNLLPDTFDRFMKVRVQHNRLISFTLKFNTNMIDRAVD